jgi:hypothetical protein
MFYNIQDQPRHPHRILVVLHVHTMVASSRAHAHADARRPVTHVPQRRDDPRFHKLILPASIGLDEGMDARDQGGA